MEGRCWYLSELQRNLQKGEQGWLCVWSERSFLESIRLWEQRFLCVSQHMQNSHPTLISCLRQGCCVFGLPHWLAVFLHSCFRHDDPPPHLQRYFTLLKPSLPGSGCGPTGLVPLCLWVLWRRQNLAAAVTHTKTKMSNCKKYSERRINYRNTSWTIVFCKSTWPLYVRKGPFVSLSSCTNWQWRQETRTRSNYTMYSYVSDAECICVLFLSKHVPCVFSMHMIMERCFVFISHTHQLTQQYVHDFQQFI